MKNPTWLLDFKRDVYSQTGEDGVIEKILEILPGKNSWCVEFGAWDGLHLTNTRHLIESAGYSAVLIEADKRRFESLRRNYLPYGDKVVAINRFVGFGDDDNLDAILSATPMPPDFDVLSIDIDGNDYHVWNRVKSYRPKVVIIEFNHTIPTEVRFVQKADPSVIQGSSLLALVELGKTKGYELVSVLRFNAVFVRKEDFPLFAIQSNSPQELRTDLSAVTYLFSGYDGGILLSGAKNLPWHSLSFDAGNLQVLPRFLRKFPDSYHLLQRVCLWGMRAWRQPASALQSVRTNLSRSS
jgi:hypothetical protein